MVVVGTGADERRVGLPEFQQVIERDWAQSEAATAEIGWYSVSAAGPVAWVAADVIIRAQVGDQAIQLGGRLTAVLERRRETWLIVQFHMSLPSAEQEEGDAWGTPYVASLEENKALARRIFEEGWTNPDSLDEYVAANLVVHGTNVNSVKVAKRNLAAYLAGLPDTRYVVEDIIAEGDKVVVRFTVTATHTGEWLGIAPTNKKVMWTGIDIIRIEDGKSVEEWYRPDTFGLLRQLDAIPPLGAQIEPVKAKQG